MTYEGVCLGGMLAGTTLRHDQPEVRKFVETSTHAMRMPSAPPEEFAPVQYYNHFSMMDGTGYWICHTLLDGIKERDHHTLAGVVLKHLSDFYQSNAQMVAGLDRDPKFRDYVERNALRL